MTRDKQHIQAGAIGIIEEATHLLRLSPARIFIFYYIGSIPFILGFLYFWADMSRSALAYQHSAEAAFSLSFLFIWMKCWQALFCLQLRAFISSDSPPPWSVLKIMRLFMVQTAIQPTGLVTLPIAAIITLPFGWVYAFYQNVSVFGNSGSGNIKSVYKKSLHHAMLFPGQNHMILFILSVFGMFVFLNIGIFIYEAPYLLKMLSGVETVFTKAGPVALLNTTWLAVTCGIVYLLVDPLIKTVYTLRCFYGEALHTGEDLKVELRNIRPAAKTASILLLFSLALQLAAPVNAVSGSGRSVQHVAGNTVSAKELDRSISEVIIKREYAWRMPREMAVKYEEKGLFAVFIEGVFNTLSSWLKPVGKWIKKALDWLIENLFKPGDYGEPSGKGWKSSVKTLVYALLGLIACLLAIFLWRTWKRRKIRGIEETAEPALHIPDIADEKVAADELPADTWLKLARDLMEQGNLRLALRALYLASLSHLAELGLITIAGFKSNREYEKELFRNAHSMPELAPAFAENIKIFERIWYGMYEVTTDVIGAFDKNHERIMAIAEK